MKIKATPLREAVARYIVAMTRVGSGHETVDEAQAAYEGMLDALGAEDSTPAPGFAPTDSQLIAFAAVIRAAEFGECDDRGVDTDGDAFVLATARRLGIDWVGER